MANTFATPKMAVRDGIPARDLSESGSTTRNPTPVYAVFSSITRRCSVPTLTRLLCVRTSS
eukprot:7456584-Heterocapsa_arctica.AAC.1